MGRYGAEQRRGGKVVLKGKVSSLRDYLIKEEVICFEDTKINKKIYTVSQNNLQAIQ